ncbi:MAG: ParB/RepB/Spo0J family partition protein [Nitrospinota bacterium]
MTKKYEYLQIQKIDIHPDIDNHRELDQRKVSHYQTDILKNGLLEPLVVWEKKQGEYFLVGGFHRLAAIQAIRNSNPGYFDRVDVRVVSGEPDEIRALNLKLNADRVDTKITDFFGTVVYLNNANWSKEKIAEFLDKSLSWVDEIIRYAPGMDPRVRKMLENGKITWQKGKAICRAVMNAPAGKEKTELEKQIKDLGKAGTNGSNGKAKRRPLTFNNAKKRLSFSLEKDPTATYAVTPQGLLSLILLLEGKEYEEHHIECVRDFLPVLMN